MEDNNKQKNRQVKLMIIGIAILVIGLVGITYAFFNYTRTGTANTIRTGRIAFNTTQTSGEGGNINLSNVFPIDVTNGVPSNNANVGEVVINVTGDTEYGGGIEYLVSAVNVTNTYGSGSSAKTLPISIDVTVASNSENDPATTLGTASNDYYNDRGGDTSYYSVLAGDTITTDSELLTGYIAPGSDGVDGNIVIKAYIDAAKVGISDTYYENAPVPTPIAPNDEYGTPASFGEGRTVFTTSEWNSFQQNGISFQVKVEAQEDTWVPTPIPTATPLPAGTIDTCPGCKFMYASNDVYQYGGASNPDATLVADIEETISNNYNDIVEDSGMNIFIGFTETQDGKIDRAFACGIKQESPNEGLAFCIEGTSDGSKYVSNEYLLHDETTGLWQEECDSCEVTAQNYSSGQVHTDTIDGYYCIVAQDYELQCGFGG